MNLDNEKNDVCCDNMFTGKAGDKVPMLNIDFPVRDFNPTLSSRRST